MISRPLVRLLSPLLIGLLLGTGPILALTYPADPVQALAQYNQLKASLAADCSVPASSLAAADHSLRGKTVEVAGRFQSMMRWEEGGRTTHLFLLQTPEGVTLTIRATEALVGIRLDEPVRVLAQLPADAADRDFLLQGLLRESDLPPSPPPVPSVPAPAPTPAPSPITPPATPARPGPQPPGPPPPTVAVWDGITATADTAPANPDLPNVGMDQAGIDKWKAWVSKCNPRLTDLQLELTVRWVIAYSAIFGIDHRLSFAMIKAESSFNPLCRSHAGALGMTQIMYNELESLGCSDPWNVQQNIRAGLRELSEDLNRYKGRSNYEQCILGLAAYNAGPGAVKKYGGVPPYKETQNYVVKVSKQFRDLVEAGYP